MWVQLGVAPARSHGEHWGVNASDGLFQLEARGPASSTPISDTDRLWAAPGGREELRVAPEEGAPSPGHAPGKGQV